MRSSPLPWLRRSRCRTLAIGVAGFLLFAALCLIALRVHSGSRFTAQARIRHHAPWVLGPPDARFTIIEYTDLECPYCREYFPVLERWINEHPQVNWEWWNLPLTMHDPAASREAQLVECVGEVDGNRAFWRAVAWIYQHTRSDGAGIPPDMRIPEIKPSFQACLGSGEAQKIVRAQSVEASRQHIVGTPTLKILDRKTGRSLELQGPATGDSLLSAIAWLAAQSTRRIRSATSR